MFLRLANIFSTTERTIKDVSEQVVPLLGKTHVTVDNINSQLSQLDEAVGDVAGMTGELDQTTAVITKGVRSGVIRVSSATAGLSRGISTFIGGEKEPEEERLVEGWGKIVAGVVLGVAGTVYATNEDVRKRLPRSARDLPDAVRIASRPRSRPRARLPRVGARRSCATSRRTRPTRTGSRGRRAKRPTAPRCAGGNADESSAAPRRDRLDRR